MGKKTPVLLLLGVLLAYYVSIPLPDNTEQRWRVLWVAAQIKTTMNLAAFAELLGISNLPRIFQFAASLEEVPPTSDENVTVTETTFDSIPVRIQEILKGRYLDDIQDIKSDSMTTLMAIPENELQNCFKGWTRCWCQCTASPREDCKAMFRYDLLSRRTANRLDAVVIATNYRLAPEYHFPIPFEDVYKAVSWFLRRDVLDKYGVNPDRVGISGDSAGGNLAAAVTLQLLDDANVETKLKIQSLIYSAVQALDLDLPSYQENADIPLLPRSLTVRMWSEYFTSDRLLEQAMLSNQHVPVESSHLFQCVNWSSLLPERFKKSHIYKYPTPGRSEMAKKYPGFLDVRASPLLADDSKLRGLPLTYVITCQHDVLRDEGFMYVTRLQNVGVQVTHNHIEDGFHGILTLNGFRIADRTQNQYISWLDENL